MVLKFTLKSLHDYVIINYVIGYYVIGYYVISYHDSITFASKLETQQTILSESDCSLGESVVVNGIGFILSMSHP